MPSSQSATLAKVTSARRGAARAKRAEAVARARLESAVVHAARDGASQREIARRAGVSQPYVSQVIAANQGRFVPTSRLGYLLAGHRREVQEIVARYRARDVAVFGSVARGEDGPGSDIDLIIDIPEDMGLIAMATMEQEIAELLGTAVDVVPARLLHSHVRQDAERDALPL